MVLKGSFFLFVLLFIAHHETRSLKLEYVFFCRWSVYIRIHTYEIWILQLTLVNISMPSFHTHIHLVFSKKKSKDVHFNDALIQENQSHSDIFNLCFILSSVAFSLCWLISSWIFIFVGLYA